MYAEFGLENVSTGTNLLYVPILPSAKSCQSNSKVFLANSMKILHVSWEMEKYPLSLVGNMHKTPFKHPSWFHCQNIKKASMDDDLMKVWIEEIWLKHTQAECKRLRFQNSLLSFDAFATHLTDRVKAQLLESNYDILISAGCTSKCQPMSLANHSKTHWEDVGWSMLHVLLKVFPIQIVISVLNSQYQHVNTWSTG